MTPEKLKQLVQKYQRGQCTAEEKQWVEQWLDGLPAQEEESIQEQMSAQEERRISTILQERIRAAIAEEEPVQRLAPAYFWRVASIILLLAVAGVAVWWSGQGHWSTPPIAYTEIYSPAGHQKVIRLPDQSVVHLNSDTRIRVPRSFSGDLRQVYLEGEAFFEVTRNPNQPFVITTGNVHTRVLGTSFNVRAYKDDPQLEVVVRTGKVQVGDSTHAVFLIPNQRAIYDWTNRQLTQSLVANLEDNTAWMGGKLVFEEKTLPEIIRVLNRKYNVTIHLENTKLAHCRLNARFKNEPLPQILEKICLYLGARYTQTGTRIAIHGNTCQ